MCGTCATYARWNIVTAETGKRARSCHWGMEVAAAVNSAGRGLDRPSLIVPRGSFPRSPSRPVDVFVGADEVTSHPQGVGHSHLVGIVCIWCSQVQHPGFCVGNFAPRLVNKCGVKLSSHQVKFECAHWVENKSAQGKSEPHCSKRFHQLKPRRQRDYWETMQWVLVCVCSVFFL